MNAIELWLELVHTQKTKSHRNDSINQMPVLFLLVHIINKIENEVEAKCGSSSKWVYFQLGNQ